MCDQGGDTEFRTIGLDGSVARGYRSFCGSADDQRGGTIYTSTIHGLRELRIRGHRILGGHLTVTGGVDSVDIARDLLFREDAEYRVGPTTVTDPSTPTWFAFLFDRAVSPDGSLVVGAARNRGLDVRRMSDGKLLLRKVAGTDTVDQDQLTWAGEGRFVYLRSRAGHPDATALVECVVASGHCRRITAFTKAGFSFAPVPVETS